MLRIMMPGPKPGMATAVPPSSPSLDPTQVPSPDAGGDADAPDTTGPRYDIQKTTQAISGYLGPESGPFACKFCKHFEDPNSCGLVAGNIDPDACCNLYEQSADANGSEDDDGDNDASSESPAEDVGENVKGPLEAGGGQ